MVNEQTTQIKDLTSHHTGRATASVKAYAGEYSSLAQGYIGGNKAASTNGSASALSGSTAQASTGQEHTLKPSTVVGTADAQSLPTPPTDAPVSTMPSVPQTEIKQESPLPTAA